MIATTKEKVDNKMLRRYFGVKSSAEVKKELAASREQFKRGEYKEAGVVLKGIRAKYGL